MSQLIPLYFIFFISSLTQKNFLEPGRRLIKKISRGKCHVYVYHSTYQNYCQWPETWSRLWWLNNVHRFALQDCLCPPPCRYHCLGFFRPKVYKLLNFIWVMFKFGGNHLTSIFFLCQTKKTGLLSFLYFIIHSFFPISPKPITSISGRHYLLCM